MIVEKNKIVFPNQLLGRIRRDAPSYPAGEDSGRRSGYYGGSEEYGSSYKSICIYVQNGLSEEILREADTSIKIPMYGFTESLNISVSAAIILQSLREKLDASNVDWQFSEDRMQEVRLAWTKKTIKNSEEIIERFRNQ